MQTSQKLTNNLPPPPTVTAQVWSIYDPLTKSFIAGKREKARKEIASISKIMTCIVSLEIAEEENISLNQKITITKAAARLKGTTANLLESDELKIIDLLYGLMLPSGNDCAMALALYFGKFYHESLPIIGFVRVMNYMCEFLSLTDTFFQNPHGMSTRPNYSTAQDVGILASYALKHRIFKEIVNTSEYSCEIFNASKGVREAVWKNTNKLLGAGFDGVKTGTTDKAGPCLCARISDFYCPWIVTVLNCASSEDRWKDATFLANWAKRITLNRF